MMPIFTKPIEDIGRADLEDLLKQEYPEGSQVEYKETLPHKHGGTDQWFRGSNQIEEYARNQLLAEVVALANSHGGNLLLGFEESKTRPPVATSIRPLPRCAELAEKIRLQARDCIEPQLPSVHTKGVVVEADGSGVVIVRVPRSISAPHRLMPNSTCYARRADRTEKMSMREIQELTLSRARETNLAQARFAERQTAFYDIAAELEAKAGVHPTNAIRATAIPLDADLYAGRLYNHLHVRPYFRKLRAKLQGREFYLRLPELTPYARPILRGARYLDKSGPMVLYQDLLDNGVVDFWLFDVALESEWDAFFPEIIVGLAANALLTANSVRTAAGSPEAEYGFELELRRNPVEAIPLAHYDSMNSRLRVAGRTPNPMTYPRLSLGARSELSSLLTILDRDLWNSVGQEPADDFEVLIPEDL